jgi:hypothetical protein
MRLGCSEIAIAPSFFLDLPFHRVDEAPFASLSGRGPTIYLFMQVESKVKYLTHDGIYTIYNSRD